MDFAFSYSTSESFPEQPRELHKKIATSGTSREKSHLALRDDLTPEVIAILAQDSDPEVRFDIAMNHATPAGILASLASQYPDLIPPISTHTNAPATLKELAPFLWQTEESIFQYLDDKEATDEERTQLLKQHRRMITQLVNQVRRARKALPPDESPDMDPPRTPLLGDVWRTIHTGPSNDASPPYSQQFLQTAAAYWDRWSRPIG